MTVEWQFYLFAPLLLLMVQKKQIYRLCLFFLIAIVLFFYKPVPVLLFTDYIVDFAAGIATCYFIHDHTERMNNIRASMLVFVLMGVFVAVGRFDLSIWCGFILFAYGAVGATPKKLFKVIFNNRLSSFLGKISYSLYLSHMLVTFYFINLVANYVDAVKQPELFYCIAMPLIILVTVALSAAAYRLIENPLIQWSKKASRRFT